MFVEGKYYLVMTCQRHYCGYDKEYLHFPRQPHTNMSLNKGGYLCHDVIKTHTIKSMDANTYNNTLQMHMNREDF